MNNMNYEIHHYFLETLRRVSDWEDRHPYFFSLFFSVMIISLLLFYTTSPDISSEDLMPSDRIEFIDMEKIEMRAPRRVVKPDIAVTDKTSSTPEKYVDKAVGTSDDANAVDLAIFPNVAPPRPIGKLMKSYPQVAKDENVEATLKVEILIASNGRVKRVNILGIRLSKDLPPDKHSSISKAFARDALKILKSVRFTPPIVNGKQTPVKMEMPLQFRLN